MWTSKNNSDSPTGCVAMICIFGIVDLVNIEYKTCSKI